MGLSESLNEKLVELTYAERCDLLCENGPLE